MATRAEQTKFAGYLGCDEATGRYRVRSIDISHTGLLHKLTFPDQPALEEVFVEPLALEICDTLEGMDSQGEMLSRSDYELLLPGATFRKLRLHTSFHPTRGCEASFWFSSFEGQPLVALRHYTEALSRLPEMAQVGKLAIETIDRVLIPALNVISSIRASGAQHNLQVYADYTTRLVQEADDLILYAELVKRLVQNQDMSGETLEAAEGFLPEQLRRIARGG
ncbi:hypothetical protein SAMN06297129_0919 [Pseudooceanicola antarcticus]|uniref:Uncharacterized protein n=1 Tax=Pseudooceanicola antarcticus TaxID=1247613 RepID=A0A285IE62_9RHOB|nr:hypothetical protein [Pseudooceanicola antarcticus]PJE29193.1 hypothetical protein CVM39_12220 [Pseudooceanicola antarcticus]SNY46223.1 hypothetical protein SAMN06297129_0919 [Pseudooceanicola antarcticus]